MDNEKRPVDPAFLIEEEEETPVKRSTKLLWLVVLVLSCAALIAGLFLLHSYFSADETDDPQAQFHDHSKDPTNDHSKAPEGGTATTAVGGQSVDLIDAKPSKPSNDTPAGVNPIDWDSLLAVNSDVRGWIYIPDTNIDYPVMCSTVEGDDFYLNHNYHKQYEFDGSIYFEKQNATDFSDRNTVMYGHNLLNGRMFRTLHYFEDGEFFENHPYIYIYTPTAIHTYTVFAAYEYDDRHILNSFDFDDDAVWAEYLAYAVNPTSMNVHTRDTGVTTDDRIITLSTCVGTNKSARYLVQAVLTDTTYTEGGVTQ